LPESGSVGPLISGDSGFEYITARRSVRDHADEGSKGVWHAVWLSKGKTLDEKWE